MSSTVEQIKSRLNIVDVVQGYLKLQKAGSNLKANCPFHAEKTPSFFVSPARESWHCFGCGKGGDMFSFVMEIEGADFVEALKILAGKAGVELKQTDYKEKNEKVRLLQLMEDAKGYYESELKKNSSVIEYLKKRGLKGETAKSFGIGFAPDGWRNLYDFLKSKGYSEPEMEKAGMVIRSSKPLSGFQSFNQSYYDRFRSRIMFPIANGSGEIVGFSGRIFGQEKESGGSHDYQQAGKYINTPQTILYDKSRVLYGFDKAKNDIRKKDFCILVEGQMDAAMSHQIGLSNTVAVSGTALTTEHLKLIKRLTQKIVAAFDNDKAGLGAAERGINLALAEGFEVKVAVSPAGKDPADAALENPNALIEAVGKAKNFIEFYLEIFPDRKGVESKVLPHILSLPSDIEKAQWVKKIAYKLSVGEEAVLAELKKTKPLNSESSFKRNIYAPSVAVEKPNRLKMLKNRLYGFILWRGKLGATESNNMTEGLAEEKKKEIGDLPDEEKNRLMFEADLFFSGAADLAGEFAKLKRELEREEIKGELELITKKIKELENFRSEKFDSESESKLEKYLSEFHALTKKLNKN